MNSSEWHQVKAVLQEVLEIDPEERQQVVARKCGSDRRLTDEVIALLDAEQTLGDFISRPAYLRFTGAELLDEADELKPGDRLRRYVVLRELGRGGMGAVYLARDDELNRRVALKILPAELCRFPDAAERFVREARTISALNHPNVLTIHEIGRADSIDFIATEFVDGITLRRRIDEGPVPLREAVKIGSQVLAALVAAHAAGFIHRDIKPENIMIREDGLVKVLDFGIAKLAGVQEVPASGADAPGITKLSLSAGTPRYMSPEQLRGDALDQRSDIWSFGMVLFEMITGRTADEDRMKVLADWQDPADSLVLEQARSLIGKCLEPSLDKRYTRAQDVLEDLKKIEDELSAGHTSSIGSGTPRKLKYAISALALIIITLGASLLYMASFRAKEAVPQIRNLAVMPIESLASAADEEYFADGLTDALISDLSQISDLRVISRTSVMRYKNKLPALPEVAKELNVEAVVTSSVQRSGEIVRLSVKLVHAPTGRPLWERGYERSHADIPALQKEITRDIARVISINLTPREDTLLSNARPVDPQAYEEYLKGRFFLNKRNEGAIMTAISHFQASIARDAHFALAHAFLADAYFALGTEILSVLPPGEALEKGGSAAAKAVELDASLAEAQTSLGVIKLYSWRWTEAEANLKRAVELNPNYAAAQSWYGLYFVSQGRVGEALARMYRARDLDPLSPHITQNVGWMLHYAGQHQEEIEQYKRALELDPDFLFARRRLSGGYRQIGQHDAAIAEAEKVIAVSGRKPMSLIPLANAYASAGRKSEAGKILRELITLNDSRHISSYALARVYADLGDRQTAFELLNKAYDEKSYAMVFMKVTKDFDEAFRRDPRFVSILRRLDLAHSLP